MQSLRQYWKFFRFFFSQFNPLLAFLLLADEIRGERKYRIATTGFEEVKKLDPRGTWLSGAFSYLPSNYTLMERLIGYVCGGAPGGGFLDIGCGRGRALVVAAHFGFRDITGVEIIGAYCQQASATVEGLDLSDTRFTIHCTDAAFYSVPAGVQTVFLYNPFDETVMGAVVRNLQQSLAAHPRELYVIYVNPLFKELFLAAGFSVVFEASRYGYLKGLVLKYEPKDNSLGDSSYH